MSLSKKIIWTLKFIKFIIIKPICPLISRNLQIFIIYPLVWRYFCFTCSGQVILD